MRYYLHPETKASAKSILAVVSADLAGACVGGESGAEIGATVGAFFGNPITGGVFGAFIGAVGYGAFSSWLASPSSSSPSSGDFDLDEIDTAIIIEAYSQYCLGEENSLDLIFDEFGDLRSQIIVDSAILDMVNLDDDALNVGYHHNVILSALEGNLDIDTQTETIVDEDQRTLEEHILYSEEMKSLFDELSLNNESITSGQDSLPDIVINMYSDLICNYASECMDMVFIINKYSDCINNSDELTDEEKTSLNIGLATSLYSYNYWMSSEYENEQ